jgi:NAD(P)-dependent dehydrogenase (short-subunit alcohol dehydrogenase family)
MARAGWEGWRTRKDDPVTQTIFITGASTGLGRASALLFASKGWKVIATMRNPATEAELAKVDGITLLPLDVTQPDQIAAAAKAALARGPVDVLFNNAGYGLVGAFEGATGRPAGRPRSTPTCWACMRVTQAFLPAMRERRAGTIITTTSIGGLVTFPFNSVYHATKWGLEGWSESLAFELEPFGIRVKTVAPGGIATDFAGRSLVLTPASRLRRGHGQGVRGLLEPGAPGRGLDGRTDRRGGLRGRDRRQRPRHLRRRRRRQGELRAPPRSRHRRLPRRVGRCSWGLSAAGQAGGDGRRASLAAPSRSRPPSRACRALRQRAGRASAFASRARRRYSARPRLAPFLGRAASVSGSVCHYVRLQRP